jgi:hypothetical protein
MDKVQISRKEICIRGAWPVMADANPQHRGVPKRLEPLIGRIVVGRPERSDEVGNRGEEALWNRQILGRSHDIWLRPVEKYLKIGDFALASMNHQCLRQCTDDVGSRKVMVFVHGIFSPHESFKRVREHADAALP